MISRDLINKIEAEAKVFFRNTSGCHDFTHVVRVKNLALAIGKKEGADLRVLKLAAILHDVGRREELKAGGAFCHAELGGKIAEKILKKYALSKIMVDNIIHCIKTHRFRDQKNIPKTIEAKCLFDADKLDSIGAVGLGRAFLFAGGPGSKNLYTGNEKKLASLKKDYSFTREDSAILEYEVKLKRVKDRILTRTGKRMALRRHLFMEKFIQEFWREVAGED